MIKNRIPDRFRRVYWTLTRFALFVVVVGGSHILLSVYTSLTIQSRLTATGIIASAILTFALIAVYRDIGQIQREQVNEIGKQRDLQENVMEIHEQQKNILNNQTSLMAIQHEPRLRIHEIGAKEDRLTVSISNGGNGPIENLNIRCDILVSFESNKGGEYYRIEECEYENRDGGKFTLEPSYRGLRPATSGLSPQDISLAQIQEAVKGTYIDPTSEPEIMEAEVEVVKYQGKEEDGRAKRLHTILNDLADSGVVYVSLYFTLIGKDMTNKVHHTFITGKSRMELESDFESLVDVMETEAFGKVDLPEEIEEDIIADEKFLPF